MKLGTKLEGIIRNIFSFWAIADLSRDPNGGHFKNDVIEGVFFSPFPAIIYKTTKSKKRFCLLFSVNLFDNFFASYN